MTSDLLDALETKHGHFRYESGHHGDLWLDLDRLLVDAKRTHRWGDALAEEARSLEPAVVCGPMAGGAIVAQALASALGVAFVFADRRVRVDGTVSYEIPRALRTVLDGRRILLVDDVLNAASALIATRKRVVAARGEAVGIACLITLGETPARVAEELGLPLLALESIEHRLWDPANCPLCAEGRPLEDRSSSSDEGEC